RVTQPGADRERVRDTPVVLDEVLLELRPLLDLVGLQIDRKALHLAEEEARELRAGIRHAGEIASQRGECERPGRRRRLNDVEPLPPPVEPRLEGMTSTHPGQR